MPERSGFQPPSLGTEGIGSFAHLLQHWSVHRPQGVAWIGAKRATRATERGQPSRDEVTWQQLSRAVGKCQQRLLAMGISVGTRVVTRYENGWNSLVLLLALDGLGAIESPVDVRLPRKLLTRIAHLLETPHILEGEFLLAGAEPLKNSKEEAVSSLQTFSGNASHDSCILWTSGTTAEPKGVVLTRQGVLANARGKLAAAPQFAEDRRLSVLPWAHAYARTCDVATWLLTGGTLAGGLGWQGIMELGPIVRPTLINAVPSLVRRLLGDRVQGTEDRFQQLGLGELRVLGCGGAALSVAAFQRIQSMNIVPVQGYGLTEAGPVVCSSGPRCLRAGSVGRPIPGTEIRFTGEGQIECRGSGVMREYWRDVKATRERFTDDGWLRTGDVGWRDDDGFVYVSGRYDNVVVLANGYKISAEAVERVVGEFLGSEQVAVLAIGDIVFIAVYVAPSGLSKGEGQAINDRGGFISEIEQVCFREFPQMKSAACELRVVCLAQPMSEENGMLTPKGSVRRSRIAECLRASEEGRDD